MAPLLHPHFRVLWLTTLVSNVCAWMNEVAAAWLMTAHTSSPIYVALIQAASALPILLLSLPSGALVDNLHKPTCLLVTQVWTLATACATYFFLSSHTFHPYLLLSLLLSTAVSVAFRGPVVSSLTAEYMDTQHMPAALALNSVSMNISRVLGPMAAGVVISTSSVYSVFLLNALLSLGTTVLLCFHLRGSTTERPRDPEQFLTAVRAGIGFLRGSEILKSVIARMFLFACMTTALLSMLPLVARTLHTGALGPATAYTSLLMATGLGALLAVASLSAIRAHCSNHALIMGGTLLQACALLSATAVSHLYAMWPLMVCIGFSMLMTGNSLSLRAQLALPHWIKARGMALYQMATMGGTLVGALTWGSLATHTSIRLTLLSAALVCSALILYLSHRSHLDDAIEDLTLVPNVPKPPLKRERERAGEVVVQIEYRVSAEDVPRFLELMQSSRSSRLRKGAIGWKLTNEWQQPDLYVEEFTDTNLHAHWRRFDRITAQDMALRDEKLALHQAKEPPVVRRFFKIM
jgi:MFS family permease